MKRNKMKSKTNWVHEYSEKLQPATLKSQYLSERGYKDFIKGRLFEIARIAATALIEVEDGNYFADWDTDGNSDFLDYFRVDNQRNRVFIDNVGGTVEDDLDKIMPIMAYIGL